MRLKSVLFSVSILASSPALAKGSDVTTKTTDMKPQKNQQLAIDGMGTQEPDRSWMRELTRDPESDYIQIPVRPLEFNANDYKLRELEFKKDLSPKLREMLDEMIKCEKENKEDKPMVNNLIEAVQIVASRSKQSQDKNQILASLIDLSPTASARETSAQFNITTSDSYRVLNKMRALRGTPNSVQLAGVPEELPNISKPCLDALFERRRLSKHFPESGESVRRDEFIDDYKGLGNPPKVEADN